MQGIDIVVTIVVLVTSVILHEVAHGYMADMLGDPTARLQGRLTLNPVSHIDPVGSVVVPLISYLSAGFVFGWAKPVPYNPFNLRNQRWGTFLVGIAGVAVNFLIALIFGLILRFFIPDLSAPMIGVFSLVVFVNLLLGVFNLIPIPPLDGSKVLFSLMSPRFYAVQDFLERYSIVLLVFIIFFLWKVISPVVFLLFLLLTGANPATLGL